MLVKDLVLSPDKYLTPAYRISPFSTSDLAFNRNLPFSDEIDGYFRKRFVGRRFVYCESGRQAIHLALQHLGVADRDVVTILTTTGNFYISGCVTREIEKLGRWFGDFTVYSFPKFFPIQIGGLLLFDDRYEVKEPLAPEAKRYVQKVLSFHLKEISSTCLGRQENYRLLARRFEALGCTPRFPLASRSVPGVFLFRTGRSANLEALKTFMWAHGVESSVFYGEQAFFLPVHARLRADDLDYFFEVARAFFDGRTGAL